MARGYFSQPPLSVYVLRIQMEYRFAEFLLARRTHPPRRVGIQQILADHPLAANAHAKRPIINPVQRAA